MKKYLVIAELINKVYIIGTYNAFQKSKVKIEELFTIANQYPFNHIEKFDN